MPVALSEGDMRGVLDFLYAAGEVDGPEVFTEPVLAAFRRLIPSDRGAACDVFAGLDPKRDGICDRDVRILELLTPHLVQLHRQAAVRRAAMAHADGLTPREYEIMSHVRSGKTNKEIAQILWVSPNTVRKHLEHVFEKLGVSNRTAAASRVFGAATDRKRRSTATLIAR